MGVCYSDTMLLPPFYGRGGGGVAPATIVAPPAPVGSCIGPELVINGDFSSPDYETRIIQPGGLKFAQGWATADVRYAGFNVYPPDTSISIISGSLTAFGGAVSQVPFPGDPANGVPATSFWIYANGNTTGAPYKFLRQQVLVKPDTDYLISFYASNAIAPSNDYQDPLLQICINGSPVSPEFRIRDHADPASGHNGVDRWERYEAQWRSPATVGPGGVNLEICDNQLDASGDDVAVTAVSMREILC